MRVIGQFKQKDIVLDSFHMIGTYDGFLCGPSGRFIESSNQDLLKRAVEQSEKLFGDHVPTLIYKAESLNLKELLPNVRGLVWLTCMATVCEHSLDGSHLVVIWFQDSLDDSFKKLPEIVNDIEWAIHAKDFGF